MCLQYYSTASILADARRREIAEYRFQSRWLPDNLMLTSARLRRFVRRWW